MAKRTSPGNNHVSAQPRTHQRAPEMQEYGTVLHALPLDLEEPVRLEMTERLNQLLADTITIRDLYKKHHWQASGPTFYQLHLLFDKHYAEQAELVDTIAERIQILGGISLAMAADIAETTRIERPPRGREEIPVQLSRLLDAHQVIIRQCRSWLSVPTSSGTMGPMTWRSATCCAPTKCRPGSLASIWFARRSSTPSKALRRAVLLLLRGVPPAPYIPFVDHFITMQRHLKAIRKTDPSLSGNLRIFVSALGTVPRQGATLEIDACPAGAYHRRQHNVARLRVS